MLVHVHGPRVRAGITTGGIVPDGPSSRCKPYVKSIKKHAVGVVRINRYTLVVSTRDVGYAGALRRGPVIFQAYVPKRLELRVTVVGSAVFAAEIHSQHTRRTRHDWRRYDHYQTPLGRHALPDDVAGRCRRLVAELGLCYGAIDLILTPDGRYVFLEINPNGQYLWIEEATGLPISDALCDLLMAGARADRVPVGGAA